MNLEYNFTDTSLYLLFFEKKEKLLYANYLLYIGQNNISTSEKRRLTYKELVTIYQQTVTDLVNLTMIYIKKDFEKLYKNGFLYHYLENVEKMVLEDYENTNSLSHSVVILFKNVLEIQTQYLIQTVPHLKSVVKKSYRNINEIILKEEDLIQKIELIILLFLANKNLIIPRLLKQLKDSGIYDKDLIKNFFEDEPFTFEPSKVTEILNFLFGNDETTDILNYIFESNEKNSTHEALVKEDSEDELKIPSIEELKKGLFELDTSYIRKESEEQEKAYKRLLEYEPSVFLDFNVLSPNYTKHFYFKLFREENVNHHFLNYMTELHAFYTQLKQQGITSDCIKDIMVIPLLEIELHLSDIPIDTRSLKKISRKNVFHAHQATSILDTLFEVSHYVVKIKIKPMLNIATLYEDDFLKQAKQYENNEELKHLFQKGNYDILGKVIDNSYQYTVNAFPSSSEIVNGFNKSKIKDYAITKFLEKTLNNLVEATHLLNTLNYELISIVELLQDEAEELQLSLSKQGFEVYIKRTLALYEAIYQNYLLRYDELDDKDSETYSQSLGISSLSLREAIENESKLMNIENTLLSHLDFRDFINKIRIFLNPINEEKTTAICIKYVTSENRSKGE